MSLNILVLDKKSRFNSNTVSFSVSDRLVGMLQHVMHDHCTKPQSIASRGQFEAQLYHGSAMGLGSFIMYPVILLTIVHTR